MQIRGRDAGCHLALTPVELDDSHLPSVRVLAELRIGSFSGTTSMLWFELSAIDAFVAQLRVLEQTRQGVATLSAMSPDECELRLEPTDRAGHLLLHVQLATARPVAAGCYPTTLTGLFEVDADFLLGMPDQAVRLKQVESQ